MICDLSFMWRLPWHLYKHTDRLNDWSTWHLSCYMHLKIFWLVVLHWRRGIWIKYKAAVVQTAEDINKHFHYNKQSLFTYKTCFVWKYFIFYSPVLYMKKFYFRIYLNIFRMDVLQYQTMFFFQTRRIAAIYFKVSPIVFRCKETQSGTDRWNVIERFSICSSFRLFPF